MSEKKYPSELAERFQVRMPPGMRDRIAKAAEESGRSMNSEIVHRLDQSFEEQNVGLASALERIFEHSPELNEVSLSISDPHFIGGQAKYTVRRESAGGFSLEPHSKLKDYKGFRITIGELQALLRSVPQERRPSDAELTEAINDPPPSRTLEAFVEKLQRLRDESQDNESGSA